MIPSPSVGLPDLRVLFRTDRDEQVLRTGRMQEVEGDVETAWLPVRCGACGELVMLEGHQRGVADRDMTATEHEGQCPACGQAIRARVEYMQEGYRSWQPLANPDVEGAEAVDVDDVAERIPEDD